MRLMTDKGLLRRSERFRNHVYEPAAPREQMQKRIAGDLIERVFGGSAKSLILGALGAKNVAAADLAEIRQMIDGLDKKKRGAK
jgi:predicted transcriptional regulator